MKKIQRYLMPIIVLAILLLVAGCSGGGEQSDPNEIPVDPGTTNPIDCLFGEGEDCEVVEPECEGDECEVVEPECEGDECEVVEPECEGDECEEDPAPIAPLNLKTYRLYQFDPAKFGEEYGCRTKLVASGGVEPYTFSTTGLPDGMILNSESMKLEGTPTKIGSFTMIFTVTDADGVSETLKEKLVVSDDYTIEISHFVGGGDAGVDLGDEDSIIPFDVRSLKVGVVNGHGAAYEWTVKIDGEEIELSDFTDSTWVLFLLPDTTPEEEKEFKIEISVMDESGNEESESYEVTRDHNPCAIPLEVSAVPYNGIDELGGVKISASGGKGDYEFQVSVDSSITLYDFDGGEISDKKGHYRKYDRADPLSNVGEALRNPGKHYFILSEGDSELDGYTLDINNVPALSGIGGYKVSGRVSVVNRECNLVANKTFSIEKKQEMDGETDTLDNLKMVCDFEDINDAGASGGYKPYLEFQFYAGNDAVARVHYNLSPCNHNERVCEGEEELEALENGKDEDGDTKFFELSDFDLNDITDVKLIKHKSTYTSGWSAGDVGKLDVDLQWCRFYIEDSDENVTWFSVWDDQKNDDDLNNDEVSGAWSTKSNKSRRESYIIDRFEGWDGNDSDSIWFMGDALRAVASDSDDGFDYMTMRDNDCSDG